MEGRREQGGGRICWTASCNCGVLPTQSRVCDQKHVAAAPLCRGSAGLEWGHQPRCFCCPPCLSCLRLPATVVWSALTPCDGPIVVTHPVASSSTFKETRGEPEGKACHAASSELAINTLACPRGSKKVTGDGSAGGRHSQRQRGTSQAASPERFHQH